MVVCPTAPDWWFFDRWLKGSPHGSTYRTKAHLADSSLPILSPVPAPSAALAPVPVVAPAAKSLPTLLAESYLERMPSSSNLSYSIHDAPEIRASDRCEHLAQFGSEGATPVAMDHLVPHYVACDYFLDAGGLPVGIHRTHSFVRLRTAPSEPENAEPSSLAGDALTLLTVPVNIATSAGVVRVNAPGMSGDTVYQLLTPDGPSALSRPGVSPTVLTKILAYLAQTDETGLWNGVDGVDNHIAVRNIPAGRVHVGPFFPGFHDIAQPLPAGTFNARVCTLSQFANVAAAAATADAGWGPQEWGKTVAVVPLLSEWLAQPHTMMCWAAAHLQYPLRYERFYSDIITAAGGPIANNVTTEHYLQHLSILGPRSNVLFVLVNHQARGAAAAPAVTVQLGAALPAITATTAANSLVAGANVDITDSMVLVTFEAADAPNWNAVLDWWYRVDGSKTSMREALFQVTNYGARVQYPAVRSNAAIANPRLVFPDASIPDAVIGTMLFTPARAPAGQLAVIARDDLTTTPCYQRVPSDADLKMDYGTIHDCSPLAWVRAAASIIRVQNRVSLPLPTALGVSTCILHYGRVLAALTDAYLDSLRKPDSWIMSYNAAANADAGHPAALLNLYIAQLNQGLQQVSQLDFPGARRVSMSAVAVYGLIDCVPAGRLSYLTRCLVLDQVDRLPVDGELAFGTTPHLVLDRLGQRWRYAPEMTKVLTKTQALSLRTAAPYYFTLFGAGGLIRAVAWSRQLMLSEAGAPSWHTPHKLTSLTASAASRLLHIRHDMLNDPPVAYFAALPVASLPVNFSWRAGTSMGWAAWPIQSAVFSGGTRGLDYHLTFRNTGQIDACAPRVSSDAANSTAMAMLGGAQSDL